MMLNTTISRRGFMKTVGGLTFSFTLSGLAVRATEALAADSARINAWVTIGADDTVTVMLPVAEMGQGVLTSLPLMLAEELDADWSKVKVEYAPANPKVYGNSHPVMGGTMVTVASVSVAGYGLPMRLAGAQARRVLVDNVARQWSVPASELSTESGFVIHKASGRKISYGEVVKFAEVPSEPPTIEHSDLKKPSQFKLVGRTDIGRTDVASKVTGSAKYGIDVRLPGMVYAMVLESPMEGAKAATVNTDEVKKIKGVKQVLPLPFGVAVIGETIGAARAGRRALKVTWDTSGATAAGFDSEKAKVEYARNGRNPPVKPMEEYKVGDALQALGGASKQVEAAYWSEHCAHAQMEPMNCTARVSDDGQSAEVWTGTQSVFLSALFGSIALKTTPDKIRVHQQLLGGGYGRRVQPDVVLQAVVLANITKETVKLIWTREDDFAAARPRPMTHHILKAGLDASGNIVAWHHRMVSENVDAVAVPPRFKARGGRDYIGSAGIDEAHYGIPNVLGDVVREIRGMRVHAWRGIGSGYTKFAAESFIDEIAHATGKDPLALRLELTKGQPRANAVIRAAAEMANWGQARAKDRALGIAFSDYHGTFSAGVAEVSLDRRRGKITVHNYWLAADPGLVIQPTNAHAQLEGAVVYGLSAALLEELNVQGGAVRQKNFDEYQVMRMRDMPEIHTKIVSSDAPPTGLGEIGVVAVAPAIANAVFKLTGARLRQLPMSPQRVSAALA